MDYGPRNVAMKKVHTLITGAGPTGLGAAWRLNELGRQDWLLVEQQPYFGGLATSFIDEKGFTWDFAVHVAHSHYHYVDQLMETLLPDGFYHHERRSWVYEYGCFVPYPFQYNFRHLPERAREECLDGLLKLKTGDQGGETGDRGRETGDRRLETGDCEQRSQLRTKLVLPKAGNQACPASGGKPRTAIPEPPTFRSWIDNAFGSGIAKHFMVPYNTKIWTVPPEEMGSTWLGDRVPTVDVERVQRNIEEGVDDVAWGPNHTFQFPKQGGTGAIWKALGERLPQDNIRLSTRVESLAVKDKTARLFDGTTVQYEHLISTMPLVSLTGLTGLQDVDRRAKQLKHSHTQVVGLAVNTKIPEHLDGKTWLYCPEMDHVYYRVTPFSIFSPAHVPDVNEWCSFLCEISSPGDGPMQDEDELIQRTLHDFEASGLFRGLSDHETHIYMMNSEFGYPIPTIDRDEILNEVIPALEEYQIYSRGRFGGWKYEVANMDHSVMQGVEAVNRVVLGEEEVTWKSPGVVNGGKR